jgi:hypothetical protein
MFPLLRTNEGKPVPDEGVPPAMLQLSMEVQEESPVQL